MGFRCGIVGLPNVGKSTIFNALTASGAAAANFPFCTIDPNVGVVPVPDPRLGRIDKHIHAAQVIPASMEFVDIAGLVKGAAQGEGLGNKFLAHIRETDAIAHVVRCFEDEDVTHVEGGVDPLRDVEIIEAELMIADFATTSAALERYRKQMKAGRKETPVIVEMLEALAAHLENVDPARSFPLADWIERSPDLAPIFRDLHLLTAKPVLYVCNVDEDTYTSGKESPLVAQVRKLAAETGGAPVLTVSGQIEAELAALDEADREEMLSDLGITEPGLHRVIRAGYEALGRQTYFTAGEKEIRAWTIRQGDDARTAAGVIHTDFARGFICAEVFTLADLEEAGSKAKAKENGRIRLEGKDYVVQDGDIMEFRFNV